MQEESKRLFFGLEVLAPWPSPLPQGRLIQASCRHLTLAFLGQTSLTKLLKALPTIPLPLRSVGFAGLFDTCLFLPPRHPHVVAWHVQWMSDDEGPLLEGYQQQLVQWIKKLGLSVDEKHTFLPHVTLCRSPFQVSNWKRTFARLPLITHNFNLYESMGQCCYRPCWSHTLKLPFEEIEHTADLAFIIRGETIQQLYQHACIALAFKFPSLVEYFKATPILTNLDDVVIYLNELVAQADANRGCPFKAISFHGAIQKEPDHTLKWEMIIDV